MRFSGPATIDCQSPYETITTSGTILQSTNHPNNYINNQDCQVTITFGTGQFVSIQFTAFNIETHSSCVYDWLEIRDGDSASSPLIGSRMCGTTIPGAIQSTGNSMTIRFHSDGANVRSGFKFGVYAGESL